MATSRNAVITKLKDELDAAIRLIVHTREACENELSSEWAQKKLAIDKAFVAKLKELTSCFNSLTESKIRLDKAEKAMERDMTPEEEREAVKQYLADMKPSELRALVAEIRRARGAEHGDYDPPEPDDE